MLRSWTVALYQDPQGPVCETKCHSPLVQFSFLLCRVMLPYSNPPYAAFLAPPTSTFTASSSTGLCWVATGTQYITWTLGLLMFLFFHTCPISSNNPHFSVQTQRTLMRLENCQLDPGPRLDSVCKIFFNLHRGAGLGLVNITVKRYFRKVTIPCYAQLLKDTGSILTFAYGFLIAGL